VRRRKLHDRFAVRQEELETGLPREEPDGGIGLAPIFLEGERRPAELRIEMPVASRGGGWPGRNGEKRDAATEKNRCRQEQRPWPSCHENPPMSPVYVVAMQPSMAQYDKDD
jgi:hypothetical protein